MPTITAQVGHGDESAYIFSYFISGCLCFS